MAAEKKLIEVAKKIAALDAANEGTQPLTIEYFDVLAMLSPGVPGLMSVISIMSTRSKIGLYKAYLLLLMSLHQKQQELKALLGTPPEIYEEKALDLFEFELGLVALGLSGPQPLSDAKSSAPSETEKGKLKKIWNHITKPFSQNVPEKKEIAAREEAEADEELSQQLTELRDFAQNILTNSSSMANRWIQPEYFENPKAKSFRLPDSCFSNLLKYARKFYRKGGQDDYKDFLGTLDELGSTAMHMEAILLVIPGFEDQFNDFMTI